MTLGAVMNNNVIRFPRRDEDDRVIVELPDYLLVPASAEPMITSPLVRAPLVRIAKEAVSAIEEGYMQELDERDRRRASVAVVALLRLLKGYDDDDEPEELEDP